MPTAIVTKPDGSTIIVNVTNGIYAVQYTDVPAEYQEKWQSSSNEIKRVVQCAWEDKDNFILECVGWCVNNSGSLERHLPEPHPFYTNMWCVAADLVEGIGVPIIDPDVGFFDFYNSDGSDINPETSLISEDAESGLAQFVLTYKRLPFPVLADDEVTSELNRYVQRRKSFAIEHQQLPGTQFVFSDTTPNIDCGLEKIALLRPSMALLYTWHDVPAENDFFLPSDLETAIQNCLGCVNDDLFDGTYPAGTLLCMEPDDEPIELANGDNGFRLTYKFIFRKEGWNTKWRGEYTDSTPITFPAGFYPVLRKDSSGYGIFLPGDFDSLFSLGDS